MKISSYNITDVGYHYIGLRVVANQAASREEQLQAIARGVLKYASDRALRLMLPEPKGNFSAVGEKVCQELVHFEFARVEKGLYELSDSGREVLGLLNDRRFVELRRAMVSAHLATYENLRAVVHRHMEVGSVWRANVEVDELQKPDYVTRLLLPTFGEKAVQVAGIIDTTGRLGAKQIEDAVNQRIINAVFTQFAYSVPLFRALCDRLVSLRLLNVMKASADSCEFAKSYSPCTAEEPARPWYHRLDVGLPRFSSYTIYLCEPNMSDEATQTNLLASLDEAFDKLTPEAGYYDLPEVRDYVCEHLRIPEAAFDEGVNSLLDQTPPKLSAGLRYEGITGRRKPLVRTRGTTTQIHNLIRRT